MKNQKLYFINFFTIILSLLVSGFIFLGSLFYKDTLDAIKLSHQQELGLSYLSTLNGILQKVALHQHHRPDSLKSEIDVQFEKLKQLHRKYAHQFSISDTDLELQNKDELKMTSLLRTWEQIQIPNEDLFLHLNLILQLRELIEMVADHSRVASDFDPRITYLAELSWLKAPENLEIISKLIHAEFVHDHPILISYLRSNLEGMRDTIRKLRFHSQLEEQSGLHDSVERPVEHLISHEMALIDAIHYSPPETIAAALFNSFSANAHLVGETTHYLSALKLAKNEQTSFHSTLLLGGGIVILAITLMLATAYSFLMKKEKSHKIA